MTPAIRMTLTALVLVSLAWSARLMAQERIALVVGNSSYQSVAALDNPEADATLIADRLEGLSFRVTRLIDADLVAMKRGVAEFGSALRAGGQDATGLFYYAGHGVQSFGFNYLLPVDTALNDAADLDLVAVEAGSVLRQMFSARNQTNIVILDACRDNPFEAIPEFNDNGLAEMKAPTGTFLAYATAPGNVALDGETGNSPFTRALAEEMLVQGAPLEQVFRNVRVRVLDETGGMQTPWDTSSLVQQFYFVEPEKVDPELVAARQMWEATRDSGDMIQIMLYLRLHPDSPFEGEARELLAQMVADIGKEGGDGDASASDSGIAAAPTTASGQAASSAARNTAGPAESEQALMDAAQASGAIPDYERYLEAYPDGVFAELARIEVEALRANQSTDPDGGAPTPAPEPEPAPAATPEPTAPVALASVAISYQLPVSAPGTEIDGRSIEELARGSPLFPPIEGLPEDYWKNQQCSNCHQWTRDALCTQAKTYLGENASRSLEKQHPYGGPFKQVLRAWAGGDCS